MKFDTIIKLTLTTALTIIVLSLGKCVWDTRKFVESTKLAVDDLQMSQLEKDYRNCLRREAGLVGVVSLKQMRKCEQETGYVD